MTRLVNVTADLSRVPVCNFPQFIGRDGNLYYNVDFAVEVTYFSAYTKYELIHGGVNYGSVAAEYV